MHDKCTPKTIIFRKPDTTPNNARDGMTGSVAYDTPVTKRLKGCLFHCTDSLSDEVFLTT